MSTHSEPLPPTPDESPAQDPVEPASTDPLAPANTPHPPGEWAGDPEEPQPDEEGVATVSPADAPPEQPLFISYTQPHMPIPSEERVPHLGHLGLLAILVILGWLGAGALVLIALHTRLWGITKLSDAATDFHYTLASQAAQYFVTFAACLLLFPVIWRRPFFDGIHWNGGFALQRVGRLFTAAVVCFFVAMINGMLMPGPTNAPIDQLFRTPGAAWVLFAFGVTLAPFFEEMAFRGFLLPSLCTAWDWSMENFTGAPRRPLAEDQSPNWSPTAMIFGSVLTSIPFALMHGMQTAWSLGPFLLLIFVSLVLCWVRLSTRSLAASTIVHACYNFMLFSFMLLGTGGFRHLDKM
jgi:uncharacterized protein